MQNQHSKHPLAKLVKRISLTKLNQAFLKIDLYNTAGKQDTTSSLRHYDLECEGIFVLEGLLKKKIQLQIMRGFNLMKNSTWKARTRIAASTYEEMTDSKRSNFSLYFSSVHGVEKEFFLATPNKQKRRNILENRDQLLNATRVSFSQYQSPHYSQRSQEYRRSFNNLLQKAKELNNEQSPQAAKENILIKTLQDSRIQSELISANDQPRIKLLETMRTNRQWRRNQGKSHRDYVIHEQQHKNGFMNSWNRGQIYSARKPLSGGTESSPCVGEMYCCIHGKHG